jgi:Flp pilus assembly pilin Flp
MHPRRRKLQHRLAKLLDVRGAAAIEYGLMMALVSVVVIVAVLGVGSRLSAIFDTAASSR